MYKYTLLYTCRSVAGRRFVLVLGGVKKLQNQYELQVVNYFGTALYGKVLISLKFPIEEKYQEKKECHFSPLVCLYVVQPVMSLMII